MYSNKKSFLYIKKIITLILIFSFISISTPFIKEVNANNNDEVLKDGILEFIKTDSENNKGLKGATIEFYKINESIPFLTGTTDENGFISKRGARGEVDRISDNGKIILNEGSYFFRETKAPRRYILKESEQMFDIMEGETTKEVFKNEKEKPKPSDKYNLLSNNKMLAPVIEDNKKSLEIDKTIKFGNDKNKSENENIEDVPSTGYDFTVFKYIGLALVAIGLIISFSGRKKSK